MAQLPSPGDSFDQRVSARGTHIKQDGSSYTVDLSGDLRFEIRRAEGAPSNRAVLVAVPRFRLTGEPDEGRDRGSTPGQVTIEQGESDVDRRNLLRLTGGSPSRLDHVLVLDLKVTLDDAREGASEEDGADRSRRLVLRTKEPALFRNPSLDDFPPEGDDYRLLSPVLLVDDDDSDNVIAVIDRFPLRIGGDDD